MNSCNTYLFSFILIKMQQIFKYEIWWYCIHLNLANACTPIRNVQLWYTGKQRTTAHVHYKAMQ